MDKTYKIKLKTGRVLGPLSLDRVAALARKGIFFGDEETATEPFAKWKRFSSFPELAELLLEKIAREQEPAKKPEPSSSKPGQKKAAAPSNNPEPKDEPEESFNSDPAAEMPTLLEIKRPPPTPETERTMAAPLVPTPKPEATKMIDASELAVVVEKAKQVSLIEEAKEQGTKLIQKSKRQLLSPRTAVFLAIALVIIGFRSMYDEDDNKAPTFNLTPLTKSFPYIGASVPSLVGKVADPRASLDYVEAGIPVLEKSTPLSTIQAVRDYFNPAVQKNPKSLIARSLLATGYIRLAEVLPRDELYFDSLRKLLTPAPAPAAYIPEYVVARIEYLNLLQRYDQAMELVDDYLKHMQTPELLYQKARLHFERREIDTALTTINNAVKSSPADRVSPRHRLLFAELLALRKPDAAAQELKTLLTQYPQFGPGLVLAAKLRLQANQPKAGLSLLSMVYRSPLSLDRIELGEAFLVGARALEAAKDFRRALLFAEAARQILPNTEDAEGLVYRLRSQLPESKTAYSLIITGRRFENERLYDKAENNYVLAREAAPTSAVPLVLWGGLLEKWGKPIEAIDRYGKALQTNPQMQDAALKLAELYIKRYDFEPAKEMLDRASTFKRNLDKIDFWRGYVMRKVGKASQGEMLYKRAISNGSRFPELFVALGDIEADRKNRELAEFYYAMALRYEPLHARALLGAALARFHLESPSRAIAFLKDKLNTQPNSAPIMTNLAVIYRYSGDKDSTKNYLQNAMRSDPSYAEAFRQIGDLAREEAESYSDNLAAKENNYRFALASYEGYSKFAPFDPEGYMATAELYFHVHDLGAAAKNYYKVLELAPNYPGVRLRLARISLNGRDPNKALQLVQEELKRYPESSEGHIELGRIDMAAAIGFREGGDRAQAESKFAEAAAAFTNAARLDPENVTAVFYLGYVNLERGNFDSAQTLLERAKKSEPLSPDVHLQLGRVYLRKHYMPKANAAFNDAKALTQDPEKLHEIDEAIRGK